MSVSLQSMTGELGFRPNSHNISVRAIAVEDVVKSYGFPRGGKRGAVGIIGGKRWAFLTPGIEPGDIIAIPEWMPVEVPAEMSNDGACTLVSAGVSAQFLTHTLMPVSPGAAILVSSVPSRLMELATAMARAKGATVTGEALTDSESLFLSRTGAHPLPLQLLEFDICYMGRNWPWPRTALARMKPNGCVVQVANQNAPRLLNGPFIMRPTLPGYAGDEYEFPGRAATVFRLYKEGKLSLVTD